MKIFIRTDENWQVLESCPEMITDWVEIDCTEEQFELLQKQYDTIVQDWEIISQVKWENAINLEKDNEPVL
jgi:hypothetical protein